jgi:hypothetical protein
MAVMTEMPPLEATALGIIAGGSTAGAVHLAKAKTRNLSSVTTAGIANPLLSLVEDVAAILGAVISIVLPLLVAILAVVALVLVVSALRRTRSGAPSASSRGARVGS